MDYLYTTEKLEGLVGSRADDLRKQTVGTIVKLQRQPFLKWTLPLVTTSVLIDDTISETLILLLAEDLLPAPPTLDFTPYINQAAASVFAAWRTFHGVDSHGKPHTVPRNPEAANLDGHGPVSWSGFDIYRENQFVTSARRDSRGGTSDRTAQVLVLMSLVLDDEQLDMLTMLSNGLTQEETASHMGFVFNPDRPTFDGRAFIQSKLRTVRRILCGATTQTEAAEWLATL